MTERRVNTPEWEAAHERAVQALKKRDREVLWQIAQRERAHQAALGVATADELRWLYPSVYGRVD